MILHTDPFTDGEVGALDLRREYLRKRGNKAGEKKIKHREERCETQREV